MNKSHSRLRLASAGKDLIGNDQEIALQEYSMHRAQGHGEIRTIHVYIS